MSEERARDDALHLDVANVVGDQVGLGPLRRDLVPLHHGWFNDWDVMATMDDVAPERLDDTLIQGGEVYAPEPLGVRSVLLVGGKIGRVGEVDRKAIERTGLPLTVIGARGCVVTPGLIDPHEHLPAAAGSRASARASRR